MAKWVTIGNDAYNIDAITRVQAASEAYYLYHGNERLNLTQEVKARLVDELKTRGMELPPLTARAPLKVRGGRVRGVGRSE